jgi:hypothetical protein
MHYGSFHIDEAIPEEFRETAQAVFSLESGVGVAVAFAESLGIAEDYRRILAIANTGTGAEIAKHLEHFRSNLDLLIQKTWVEKDDEARKERLQDQVPNFIMEIEQGNYKKALADFNVILDELAYLFFGKQSRKEDFTEYTFRIDAQMGLFWWYGSQLGKIDHADNDYLKALLLIGICYLTNF